MYYVELILLMNAIVVPVFLSLQVVPNTLSIAKEESPEARLILEATPPYRIDYVSQSWCELFGYEPSKVVGESIRSMRGMDVEGEKISILIASARVRW